MNGDRKMEWCVCVCVCVSMMEAYGTLGEFYLFFKVGRIDREVFI